MRRIVLLSSLSPGRCFTLVEPPAEFDEDDRAERVTGAQSILTPEVAWKINAIEGSDFDAESAIGETQHFVGSTRVVELPRQGWDRLAARVRGGAG
ncbi:MAG: hypothetical protein JNJ59_23580 [Deltaproteobacteria bacterium]|nr:hypothetical protein [Deltaproteobacteria bacterium]